MPFFLTFAIFAFGISCTTISVSAAVTSSAKFITLDFDDLSPPGGLSNPIYSPPAVYHELHFNGFSVFEPNSTALKDFITPWDRNCAVSQPNALLGSRLGGEDGPKASFEIPRNAEYGSPQQVSQSTWFDLEGLTMKPLMSPPGDEEITIFVKGYKASDAIDNVDQSTQQHVHEAQVLWHVNFPVEYHLPFEARMPHDFGHLDKVEIWAAYGVQRLDWEFCVDDIKVAFGSDTRGRNNITTEELQAAWTDMVEGGNVQEVLA